MRSTGMLTLVLGLAAATAGFCQIQPPNGQRTGPGVQAAQDRGNPKS